MRAACLLGALGVGILDGKTPRCRGWGVQTRLGACCGVVAVV